jgi:repressor LexA
VPVLGRIAAGTPLLAEENRDGSLPIGVEWLAGKGEEIFALRVRGESMINAHIVEGDLVLVRRQESAEPGDIVVALLDNEATVKRFGRQGEAVVLKPEHPTMSPILVRQGQKDFKILGKVVGLVRGF